LTVLRRLLTVVIALSFGTIAHAQAPKLPEFHNIYWTHQDGESTRNTQVILVYGETELDIWPERSPKKQTDPLLVLPYQSIQSAEYTFAKSPNVAAGLFISPLFFLTSSKSHWLTVKQASGEYVVLRMDGGFYRLVLAELEKRTGVTVQSIGENK
jgi:hypothetical protein